MKILIISDSHGNFSAIRKVLSMEKDAQMLIHCGDIEGD
ncbi:MAG: metallophosphoesterase family protein, partial [Lachnospiraceae bacterium]|nr:metallophosphoesterase family protein [Lachnospiraceae bacterium]